MLEDKKKRDVSLRLDGNESKSESECESEDESEDESETESEFVSETDSEFKSEKEDAGTEKNATKHGKQGAGSLRTKPQPQASMRKEQETNHLARLMGQQRRPDQPTKKPIIEVLPTD